MKIPQEEPKQDLRKYPLTPDECFKQETLEEAAEKYATTNKTYSEQSELDFKAGAYWQQEKLEEYIKEVTKNFGDEMSVKFTSGGIKLGAKWQAERIGLMEIELRHTKTLLASCEKALEDRDKQAERMYSSLFKLRNELCDTLPTGDVDAFELLKLINIHLQKLDNLCGNK